MNRMKLWYLSLAVAAYMIGLGNVWRFPVLAMKHGMGGVLVYLMAVFLMVGIIGTAMESTKKRRYGIVEYYLREHGKPAFGILFLLFDVLFIAYYSILGGLTVTSVFLRESYRYPMWSVASLIVFVGFMSIVLLQGRERTFDFMIFSLVTLFITTSTFLWILYSTSKIPSLNYVTD